LNTITSTIGFVLVLVAIVLIIADSASTNYDRGDARARFFGALFSRCLSYIIYWLTVLCVYFNPLVACGQTDPFPEPGFECKLAFLGDMSGIGQWRIQKQYFQNMCFHAAKDMIAKGTNADEAAVSKRGARPKPMHYTPQCMVIC